MLDFFAGKLYNIIKRISHFRGGMSAESQLIHTPPGGFSRQYNKEEVRV